MITVTFTDSQYKTFQALWTKAEQEEIAIAELFGHKEVVEVQADYQLPSDSILEDMADYYASIR